MMLLSTAIYPWVLWCGEALWWVLHCLGLVLIWWWIVWCSLWWRCYHHPLWNTWNKALKY